MHISILFETIIFKPALLNIHTQIQLFILLLNNSTLLKLMWVYKRTRPPAPAEEPPPTTQVNRLCSCLKKLKPKSCRSILRKWVSFFRCGYCKNSRNLHYSPPATPKSRSRKAANDNGEEDEHLTVEGDNRGLISRTPPQNAFLLTRCRYAPYRSSSLASKFWGSTMEKTEGEEVAEKIKNLSIEEKKRSN